MTARTRRAVGSFLMLLWMTAYIVAVWVAAVEFLPDSRWIEIIFYPLAGIAWIPVAMLILKKFSRATDQEIADLRHH